MTIAHDLRAWRDRRKLTRKEAGRLLKIPYRTLQNWEQGRRQPSSLEAIRALMQLLDEKSHTRAPQGREP